MNGAHEYAGLFKSAQYGNLYLLSHHHARGQTFQIFVVPEGVQVELGGINAPHGGIEVYGILGGHPGWTELYGWIHKGPWQQDFYKPVAECRAEIEKLEQEKAEALAKREKEKKRKREKEKKRKREKEKKRKREKEKELQCNWQLMETYHERSN